MTESSGVRFLAVIGSWINRHFSNEEAIYLVALLVAAFFVLFTLGRFLAPILTAIVLAYLLQGLVERLMRARTGTARRLPHLRVVPLRAAGARRRDLPARVAAALDVRERVAEPDRQSAGRARGLPERLPNLVSKTQVETWLGMLGDEVSSMGRAMVQAIVGQVLRCSRCCLRNARCSIASGRR
jgi:putative permease